MKRERGRHPSGQILIVVALLLTFLIGSVGLAAEGGLFLDVKRRMQTAADAAAVAGALEIARKSSSSTIESSALADASRNGFEDGVATVKVTVSNPPVSGLHVGSSKFVEVVLQKSCPTAILRALGFDSVTVQTRASGPWAIPRTASTALTSVPTKHSRPPGTRTSWFRLAGSS